MLNHYKLETQKICEERGWDGLPVERIWLLLSEEFGELASAIRQYKKVFKKINLKKERGQDVKAELGDVFSYLFQLSFVLDIDLDEMWDHHKRKLYTKKYAPNVKTLPCPRRCATTTTR